MRKLQKMAVVTLAIGGLSAMGAGIGFADAPPPAPQGQSAMQPEMAPQAAPVPMQAEAAPAPQAAPVPMQAEAAPQAAPVPMQAEAAPQAAPVQAPQAAPVQAPQAAPESTQIAPQVAPQMAPQISPQVAPVASVPQVIPQAERQSAPQEQNNVFRPYQECSPQTVVEANVPIALFSDAKTQGDTCTQVNNAFIRN